MSRLEEADNEWCYYPQKKFLLSTTVPPLQDGYLHTFKRCFKIGRQANRMAIYLHSFYALYKLRTCNFYSDIRFAICSGDGETSPWTAWLTTPTLPGDMWPPSFQSRVLHSTCSNMDHFLCMSRQQLVLLQHCNVPPRPVVPALYSGCGYLPDFNETIAAQWQCTVLH